ncbi:hypothetical protein F3Y22_tig00110794pilonHSYRG00222 [Hibiscus syriacus]|uniref:Bifunctional inhibitor/plant lipid transfer protein/seed storage helical domain-containing protein n=1 Tax=Hibiscus syriacus TaxID=106335 RepID=A0A6A2ZP15_HIBSY|nr:uncharacterized protein LOC120141297 [Hibiscus syriacus]KAE8693771.1 hypothetical protein F3Y22_tig00110794pilonHSYRG00222 [Hibiscus syriacus]
MTKVVIIAISFLLSLFTVAVPTKLPRLRGSPRPICVSQISILNYACGGLPLSPFPPPSHHRNSHGRSSRKHRHRRRHGQRRSDRQNYCCQWLRQVDDECVCDVLAHLPPFLSRPNHQYSIAIGDTCTIRFSCGGRLVP